jgi:hypothetical protein
MATSDPAPVTPPATVPTAQEQLSHLFGSYKAEWLREQLFDLFSEPAYFPKLTTPGPCILVGGRGTGKTTVLRSLSYEGQYALTGRRPESISDWPYYGLYYRVNTNRVTAFRGPELALDKWIPTFAHYFNLLMCDLLLRFLDWYQIHRNDAVQLPSGALQHVALSLHLPKPQTLSELADSLDTARVTFEAYINNVADGHHPPLSLQGAPIDALAESILQLSQFRGKQFFFLLDEYENFEDYQQQVVNTLIKHASASYTFKIGVKELGLRRRATLLETEQLVSPADYVRINIVDKLEGDLFKSFAQDVCNSRLSRVRLDSAASLKIETALTALTEDEEADLLGVRPVAEHIKTELLATIPSDVHEQVEQLTALQLYFIQFWAQGHAQTVRQAFQDSLADPTGWQTRYGNYRHSLLYTLRRGKRGIRKYYAGWDVYTQLAAGNIRYLLELVDQSLLLHLRQGEALTAPVSPKTQTEAAQYVGKKNLAELEGLSVHGAQLTKLLLGLGRVFQTMAADASGHAPEVNQFHLPDDESSARDTSQSSEAAEAAALLSSAVMHLALIRSTGNKLADEFETKDYDYMMHPVFAPFFVFSYRRKRKMRLTSRQLLGLVHRPRETIREILAQNNRTSEEALPEQLVLFERFYDGGT